MHKNIHRFPENLYKSNNIISFFNQYFKYLLELVLSHDIFVIINLLKNGNSFQKKEEKTDKQHTHLTNFSSFSDSSHRFIDCFSKI